MADPVRPKVKAQAGGGSVGGAISVVAVWAIGELGWDMPAEVAAALGTIVTAGVGFLAGYLKRD